MMIFSKIFAIFDYLNFFKNKGKNYKYQKCIQIFRLKTLLKVI